MTPPAPKPADIRIVVGDLHGNHAAARALLEHVGVLDVRGRRRPGFFVIQVGDLVHGGHDVYDADREMLELAPSWFDVVLVGNHELPFLAPWGQTFEGMHRDGRRAWHPACQVELNRLQRDGFFHAACEVDGWLITHAGLSPEHLFDDEGRPTDKRLRKVMYDPAKLAAHLNARFEERFTRKRGRDLVIDGSCPYRSGSDQIGSIFWRSLHGLVVDFRKHGNPVPQIVGHTPRIDELPALFGVRDKDIEDYLPPKRLGFNPVWATDLAGIDDGWVGALVRKPGDSNLPYEAWTPVSVPRPIRPHSDPEHPTLLSIGSIWAHDWSAPYGGFDI